MPGAANVQLYRDQGAGARRTETPPRTQTIDLESQGLSTFDLISFRVNTTCANVTELNLNYNSLSSLPNDFASAFPQLQVLSLSGNDLKELPPCIGCLTELVSLTVNENEIAQLPLPLFHLPKLLELHLLGNRLKQLHPDVSCLHSLRSLTLEDNQLTDLPATFGDLKGLQVLEASENVLEFLPKNFGKLSNLSILNLSRNKLIELPDSFGDLPSLQYVDLSNNYLSELSTQLVSASKTLLKFSASDNLLKRFPAWIGELATIQEFYLGNNYIDHELPEQFGGASGSSLRHMDLGANYLDHLPESIGHLTQVETLHFGSHILEIERRAFQNGNRITHLPESFGQLTNLRHLRLDENQLGRLPESFGDLRSLEYLDLGQNVIRELPASFSHLGALKVCLLSKNHIQRLPHDFGNLRALERLRLNTNQLRELPESFCQLSELQILDLVDNRLPEFPSCLNRLTKLVRVALDDNDFELDIPEVNKLDGLAKYPGDGIHKFVRTTVSHSEDQANQMTSALASAMRKGDSIWKSHAMDDQEMTADLEDEVAIWETSEHQSDCDVSVSTEDGSSHSWDQTNLHTEPENWDMEMEEENPFSCDEPVAYQHNTMRCSPQGKDVLNFEFVPSHEHPPCLPVPDIDFNFEDGQFEDAD